MSTLDLVRPTRPDSFLADPLSRREIVVLQQLCDDATLAEIAARLFVSRNTIKTQVRSLYRKIGVSTRAGAVSWAVAASLAQEDPS